MMALAVDEGAGPVMLKGLAERHGLPPTYLEQLMVPLRKSGMLTATRGARGGYRLGRPAQAITVCEIVEVLEGPIAFVDCTEIACCGIAHDACALRDLLDDASNAARRVLDGVTLAQLVERQRAKADASVEMYVI